jgi:hypothetical protein
MGNVSLGGCTEGGRETRGFLGQRCVRASFDEQSTELGFQEPYKADRCPSSVQALTVSGLSRARSPSPLCVPSSSPQPRSCRAHHVLALRFLSGIRRLQDHRLDFSRREMGYPSEPYCPPLLRPTIFVGRFSRSRSPPETSSSRRLELAQLSRAFWGPR